MSVSQAEMLAAAVGGVGGPKVKVRLQAGLSLAAAAAAGFDV